MTCSPQEALKRRGEPLTAYLSEAKQVRKGMERALVPRRFHIRCQKADCTRVSGRIPPGFPGRRSLQPMQKRGGEPLTAYLSGAKQVRKGMEGAQAPPRFWLVLLKSADGARVSL